MLEKVPLQLNLATTDLQRAKTFYTKTLGVRVQREMEGALILESGGQSFLMYEREAPPKADHTLATFTVPDVRGAVKDLAGKGVRFERYDGFGQDELGISSRGPDGPKMAWFKDPDGNILGLLEVPKGR